MSAPLTISLVDGVRIVVPDDLNKITTYVLLEQQDWFEDDIRFLRQVLQPGQQAIDIGANHGVYTLSMAHSVGHTGRVWAFEPASSTAEFLAQGIAANAFNHVQLERSALSSTSGTAQLGLNANSELNELVRGASGNAGLTETVALTTLDACMERFAWQGIDVMKLDAEGEEANILKGGARFFEQNAPLVMYEVKAGNDLHLELVDAFAAIGYAAYRLVPALDVLVPFDPTAPVDPYQLNLYACKPERAAELAARGLLADRWAADPWSGVPDRSAYRCQRTLAALPYGRALAGHWAAAVPAPGQPQVIEALTLHSLSQDRSRSAIQRAAALRASLALLQALCRQDTSRLRLASLARVADDFGDRGLSQQALANLGEGLVRNGQVDPTEPFLAPLQRFESVDPGSSIGAWVLAAVLEAQERRGSHSSFFTGNSARARLEAIRDLGFGDAQMRRRLEMVEMRFGPITGSQVNPSPRGRHAG
jgi:FkbM family methyltransferase